VYREAKRTFAIDYEIARFSGVNMGEMLMRLKIKIREEKRVSNYK